MSTNMELPWMDTHTNMPSFGRQTATITPSGLRQSNVPLTPKVAGYRGNPNTRDESPLRLFSLQRTTPSLGPMPNASVLLTPLSRPLVLVVQSFATHHTLFFTAHVLSNTESMQASTFTPPYSPSTTSSLEEE